MCSQVTTSASRPSVGMERTECPSSSPRPAPAGGRIGSLRCLMTCRCRVSRPQRFRTWWSAGHTEMARLAQSASRCQACRQRQWRLQVMCRRGPSSRLRRSQRCRQPHPHPHRRRRQFQSAQHRRRRSSGLHRSQWCRYRPQPCGHRSQPYRHRSQPYRHRFFPQSPARAAPPPPVERAAPAPAAPLPPRAPARTGAHAQGRVVDGKWLLLDKSLGNGRFGTVFAGRDVETGAPVAVKMCNSTAEEMGTLVRQQREIGVQRQCGGHPNLLPILGCVEEDDRCLIVTPCMEGGDLARLLVAGRCLDPVPLRQLCGDLLCGLGELQRRNIVHRDFKPANLLLSSSDPLRAVLKIADYGFAKPLQRPDDLVQTKCGSPAYAAPEVFDMQRAEYCTRADTFSVGVVMWEMASGCLPFIGSDVGRLRRRMLEERTLNDKKLPRDCLQCCKKMLKPEPTARPTIDELERSGDPWLRECREARSQRDASARAEATPLTRHDPATLQATASSGGSAQRSGGEEEEHIGSADGAGWVVLRGRPLLEGTLGAVFEGRSSGTQERVAVKELKKDRLTPSQREMLDLEVGLAGRREEHANLLTVVAALEEPGRYLIVTPFMDGGDLAQELRGGPLVGVALRQQCGDLLCGLGELQRRKVVHRDIKPQNLLLTSRDRLRAVLKIGDFASAKAMGDADDLMMTKCGSPSYAAPEVFDVQQRMYSASADTFSAGVVMAEMGTGGLPFVGTEIGVLRRQMMRQQLRRSELLPPACLVCCKLMLAYNPSERPSVAQLRTDGDAWLLECVAACEERDTGVRRAPSAQAAAADPGTGAGDVGALTRGSGPSVNLAAHGLALQSASEVLCFSHDAARGRFLVGMRGGFNVTAVGGDGGAGSVSEQDQFRALGGGVGAIVAVGASVAGVPAKDGLLLAIAGGGRPAALPIGTVALWDENAGAGRPVDRIDVGEPVVSLAAERTWLAVVCPEHVFVCHLNPRVGVVPVHKLLTASNPLGVVALRCGSGGGGGGLLCFPDMSEAGTLSIAELKAPPEAAAAVRNRRRTLWPAREEGAWDGAPPQTAVAGCGLSEHITALAIDAEGEQIAATTRSGRWISVFSRQGGAPVAQLGRGWWDADVISLSFSDCGQFLCTASNRTVHVWKKNGQTAGETADLFEYWAKRTITMENKAVFAGFCRAVQGAEVWVYGPEQERLEMLALNRAAAREAMGLVDRTRGLPPPSTAPTREEVLQRLPPAHSIALAGLQERESEAVFKHLWTEPTRAARLVWQLEKECETAVAVVVREDELVLIPTDRRRGVVVVDPSWVRSVARCAGSSSHPHAANVDLRFAGSMQIRFKAEDALGGFVDNLATLPATQGLSPMRRLWLFLLWQRQLDGADRRRVPSQRDGELRGMLGPCSVLHHVQLFIAGPRPCPLPWGGPAAEWFLSRVIGALRPW
eukprot:TRINITY_DN132_c0_g1_i7.p1 TRINITY_DN132_c0_g1~~TRINITY_DN132_c0_g1_i7.p1  ORF type:complete len:1435 (+),score=456.84 TRINITY_DN132_c0_g1_i7:161-4465(+)